MLAGNTKEGKRIENVYTMVEKTFRDWVLLWRGLGILFSCMNMFSVKHGIVTAGLCMDRTTGADRRLVLRNQQMRRAWKLLYDSIYIHQLL